MTDTAAAGRHRLSLFKVLRDADIRSQMKQGVEGYGYSRPPNGCGGFRVSQNGPSFIRDQLTCLIYSGM